MAIISLKDLPEADASKSSFIPIDKLPDSSKSEELKLSLPEKIADFVSGGIVSEGKRSMNEAKAGIYGDKAKTLSEGSEEFQKDAKLMGEIGQSIILGKQAGALVDGKVPTITKRVLEGMAAAQSFDYKSVGDRIKSTLIAGGISAASGAVVDKIVGKFFTPTAKLPTSLEAQGAIDKVTQSADDIVSKSKEYLDTTKQRASTSASFKSVEDKIRINDLEIEKTRIADQQSRFVQEELAQKASSNLNKAYAKKYLEAAAGKTASVDDVSEGLQEVLQDHKVLDESGNLLVKEGDLTKPQRMVYDMYKDYSSKLKSSILDESGNAITKSNEKISLLDFDRDLKSNLARGKQYGSEDHIMTDVRRAMADKVAELRGVGAEFADDFQYRNATFDKFKPYQTRAGYRRGDADVKTGMDLLKNLAHEDTAQVLPQNERIMGFIQKYTGVDPSEPVKQIGSQIKSILINAQEEALKMQYSLAEVESKVQRGIAEAKAMKEYSVRGMSNLRDMALKKEIRDKNIAKFVGGLAVEEAVTGGLLSKRISRMMRSS